MRGSFFFFPFVNSLFRTIKLRNKSARILKQSWRKINTFFFHESYRVFSMYRKLQKMPPKVRVSFFFLSLRQQYFFKQRIPDPTKVFLGFQSLIRSSLRRIQNFIDLKFSKSFCTLRIKLITSQFEPEAL